MILGTALSKNGVPIRLTKERWEHIITSHLEIPSKSHEAILNVVKNSDIVFKGNLDELLAVQKSSRKKYWIVVAYKEVSQEDGYVLTAYITTDSTWLFKKEIIWNKK